MPTRKYTLELTLLTAETADYYDGEHIDFLIYENKQFPIYFCDPCNAEFYQIEDGLLSAKEKVEIALNKEIGKWKEFPNELTFIYKEKT